MATDIELTNLDKVLLQIRHHLLQQQDRTPLELFELVESVASQYLGKGWGAATIDMEIDAVSRFVDLANARLLLDIGGNCGDYSAGLRHRSPTSEIHVFEPAHPNVEQLTARFATDRNIHIESCAVSDVVGSATLHFDRHGSGLASLARRNLSHHGLAFDLSQPTETVRIEDFWRTNLDHRPIDFVKLDIEGYELKALKGFGEAIKVTRAVQFEFGGTMIDTRTFFREFHDFFSEAAFDLYRITPFGPQQITRYRESEECYATTNFIAVNSRFSST